MAAVRRRCTPQGTELGAHDDPAWCGGDAGGASFMLAGGDLAHALSPPLPQPHLFLFTFRWGRAIGGGALRLQWVFPGIHALSDT